MSGAGRPCGPPGMQMPDCGPGPVNGSVGWRAPSTATSYVVNSKIMVVAVAVLFAVVVFILCLHVYAKWYWHAQAVAQQQVDGHGEVGRWMGSWRRRRGRRRTGASAAPGLVVLQVQTSVGLEKAVIEALPTFEFDAKLQALLLECAVCLEDFEAGEKGRTLPKCGHHFHLDCVDMWLSSHSTCPLCRASVLPDESKPAIVDPATPAVVVPINDHQPVIGDVHAPFMAAMRASRRQRQRSSSQLPTSPISQPQQQPQQQLPPIPSSDLHHPVSEPGRAPTAADPKATLAPEYEEGESIPPNVLFWGDHHPQQPSASSTHVTIDVPRGLHPASVTSPMARASASFRRLMTRGKSVVSPHDDDHDHDDPDPDHDRLQDQGSPGSSQPPPPPPQQQHSPRPPPGASS